MAKNELDKAIKELPIGKESFVGHYIVGPVLLLFVRISLIATKIHHRLCHAWYCEYCNAYHSSRSIQYHVIVRKGLVGVENVQVCTRGLTASHAGLFKAKDSLTDVMDNLVEALGLKPTTPTTTLDESCDWRPKILFMCNQLKNTTCKKKNCGICKRTEHIEYSTDNKIQWPEDSVLGRHCCVCPLNPTACAAKYIMLGKEKPCETFATYTDYILTGGASK